MVWCLFAVVFVVDTNHAVVLRSSSSILFLSSSCNTVVQVNVGTSMLLLLLLLFNVACGVVTGETTQQK